MNLPTREQCLALLEKYNIPRHIVRHSLAVERVAVFLAKKFNEAGIPVDAGLVSRGALLHDIDKIETLKEGFGHLHGKMGREILEKEGFPEIGKIAEAHHLERVLSLKPFFPREKSLGKSAPVGAKPFLLGQKSLGKSAPVGAKPFDCWEEKIVYYADKRVNHDKIVSLDERFDYLLKRYGIEKGIRRTFLHCKPLVEKLEKEIFSKIDAGPELEGLS
ncbi:MAG: HDIG domain-containing metalloprotein [archaeon]